MKNSEVTLWAQVAMKQARISWIVAYMPNLCASYINTGTNAKIPSAFLRWKVEGVIEWSVTAVCAQPMEQCKDS